MKKKVFFNPIFKCFTVPYIAVQVEDPALNKPVLVEKNPVLDVPVLVDEGPVPDKPVLVEEDPAPDAPGQGEEDPVPDKPILVENPVPDKPVPVKKGPIAGRAPPGGGGSGAGRT